MVGWGMGMVWGSPERVGLGGPTREAFAASIAPYAATHLPTHLLAAAVTKYTLFGEWGSGADYKYVSGGDSTVRRIGSPGGGGVVGWWVVGVWWGWVVMAHCEGN